MRDVLPELSLDVLIEHQPLWERMHYFLAKDEIPQALLFVGPSCANPLMFARQLITHVLCHAVSKPCGHCKSCLMMIKQSHPDCMLISPEKRGGLIKIEQIRDLQLTAYQSPQCGERRFVVIDEAHQLNLASANALLKILEEPPSHLHFILCAENANALPITVRSRCQVFVFSLDEPADLYHYLKQASHDVADSPRGLIFAEHEAMIRGFHDFLSGKFNCCQLASMWSKHALDDLLWFLYLLTSTSLVDSLKFNGTLDPVSWAHQINRLAALMKKRAANVSLNETLALEAILLGYIT
ncbi:MAG: hypothetical protein ACOYKA_00670 [Legionellaceae bacterium]